MRISIINLILLAVSFNLFAVTSSYSQELEKITVTLNVKDQPIDVALEALKSQTKYQFGYSPSRLRQFPNVTLVGTFNVKQVLDEILKDTPFAYKVSSNHIDLYDAVLAQKQASTETGINVQIITGRVTDAVTKEAIAGVNILVKGTSTGTSADSDGRYSIEAQTSDMLIFSFIGYRTVESEVGSRTVIDIAMEVDAKTLEAVEIVGTDYYTVSKATSTMNITKINGKEIQDQPVTNIMTSLIGRVPGLDVTPTNGAAGLYSTVQIRGNNSLRFGGSYPLYVIDGVQIESEPLRSAGVGLSPVGYDPMGAINPNDIESIEVLKDAAATAIYGSRGANGVIRIITKKARTSGKTSVDLSYYVGTGKIVDRLKMLNTTQYVEMRNQAYSNDGITNIPFYNFDIVGDVWDKERYTNWQDKLLGSSASIQDYQLGVTSGSGNTNFRINVGHHKEGTVYPGDFGYERTTANLNVNHTSTNKKFLTNMSIAYGWNKNKMFDDASYFQSALYLPPNAPELYDNNGNLNWQEYEVYPGRFNNSWNNPLASLLRKQTAKGDNINAQANVGYNISKHFILKTNLGYSLVMNDENARIPISSNAPSARPFSRGESRFTNNKRNSFMIEPQLAYTNKIRDHSIDGTIGVTYRKSESASKLITGLDYLSDELLGTLQGANTVSIGLDSYSEYKYVSLFSRIGYNYKDKYLLDISFRRDGSSRFGPGKQYGNFSAIGGGWIFSNEKFFNSLIRIVNFGKIRGSYGITGNDQIGDYQFHNTYSILPNGYGDAQVLVPTALFNPDFAWEVTKKAEAALQLDFFNSRISLEAAWYKNISSNQLINYNLPAITGFPGVFQNFDATIENRGWEFMLGTTNINVKDFAWSTLFNLSIPQNVLTKFDRIEGSPYATQYKVGESLSTRFFYTYKGVNPATGEHEVVDIDNDGNFDNEDKSFTGHIGRNWYGGITNSIRFKTIELSIVCQFSNGTMYGVMPSSITGRVQQNMPLYSVDRWQDEGDIKEWGKASTNSAYNSRYAGEVLNSNFNIVDANYLTIRSLTLSYTFQNEIVSKLSLTHARLYLQAQNLWSFSNFVGLSPETGNSLPQPRMITLGAQVKF